MRLSDGINLVRKKHQEEKEQRITGPIADTYQQALAKFPATMATAHVLFALEEFNMASRVEEGG